MTNLSLGATASASSQFSSEFPPSLGNDGDPTTSWFSAGPGADGTSTYTLTFPRASTVTGVEFVGNERNAHPDFRSGFGFRSWRVDLLDSRGNVLFTVRSQGSGTASQSQPVPSVPGVVQARFVGMGHEAPNCGGFAELNILGS